PLLRTLVANAAGIKDDPVCFFGFRNRRYALGGDVGAFGKLLVSTQHIGQCHDRFKIVWVLLDQRFQLLLALGGTLETVENGGHLNGGVAVQWRTGRNTIVDLDRKFRFLERLIQTGKREQRQRVAGAQEKRQLQVGQAKIFSA